jgi:hypothetical protein
MITWNITCCYTVDKVSGHEDLGRIICGADYRVSDDFGIVAEGYVDIPTSNLNNFTDYDSIVEVDVVEWVKSALGNKVNMIENKANQRGIPWQ